MKKHSDRRKETPLTVAQLIAAMQALGFYGGENTEVEHQAEVARLGSEAHYRMMLVNALLGIVETDALLADASGVKPEQMEEAHRQALVSAGVEDNPNKLLGFLRWRTLRGHCVKLPRIRALARSRFLLLHAADGLQLLLSAIASGQDLAHADLIRMTADLRAARTSLSNSLANLDLMLGLIDKVEKL